MTEPIKQLYRSRDDAQLAGICAGLGDYLRMDPVFVRVVTLTVTFLTGIVPGVLSYIAAWIIVPQVPAALPAPPERSHEAPA